MASVDTGGGEEKKGKPKKQNLRVDFTPMVDMNMLLITFFMFCTTLSKPQIMNIVMPSDDKNIEDIDKDKVPESKTITVLLGKDAKVYYYFGMPNYEDYTSLKETSFAPEGGIRKVFLERNNTVAAQMKELKKKRKEDKVIKKLSEEDYRKEQSKIKDSKEGAIVVIKPTSESTYADLVGILDEMAICSIGKYAIVDMTDGDQFLLNNLEQKGALSSQAEAVKPKGRK